MKKCLKCGTENKELAKTCEKCGAEFKDPMLIYSKDQWMSKEAHQAQKISLYAEIVYWVFGVMGGLAIIFALIFMVATGQILLGFLIMLGGIFQIFIGTIIQASMEGLSIVVHNSEKKL